MMKAFIIDNLDDFLSTPVQTFPEQCQEEFVSEVDKMLIRQKFLADFLDGKIKAIDFLDTISELDIDPEEAGKNWGMGLSLL